VVSNKRREGVAIASACPFHQVDLHGHAPVARGPSGRFREYGAGLGQNVQSAKRSGQGRAAA
jgi:hypothetical protein